MLDTLRGREIGRWGSRGRGGGGDPQDERIGAEFEGEIVGGTGGPVLDTQAQVRIAPAQVEVGIAPRVEFGATAQGLAGARAAGIFAGMVDQGDGEVVFATASIHGCDRTNSPTSGVENASGHRVGADELTVGSW